MTTTTPRVSSQDPTPTRAALRELGAFRRARRSRDRLPAKTIAASDIERFGLDLDAARLVADLGAQRLYVIPGNHWICLASPDQIIFDCWSPHTVLAGDATTAALCSPRLPNGVVELAGIVPDGVARVSIERPRRRELTVPVRSSVFLTGLLARDPLPQRLRWTRHGRRETHPSGIPPGTKRGSCDAGPTQ